MQTARTWRFVNGSDGPVNSVRKVRIDEGISVGRLMVNWFKKIMTYVDRTTHATHHTLGDGPFQAQRSYLPIRVRHFPPRYGAKGLQYSWMRSMSSSRFRAGTTSSIEKY